MGVVAEIEDRSRGDSMDVTGLVGRDGALDHHLLRSLTMAYTRNRLSAVPSLITAGHARAASSEPVVPGSNESARSIAKRPSSEAESVEVAEDKDVTRP